MPRWCGGGKLKKSLHEDLRDHWNVRNELSIINGKIMYEQQIMVPDRLLRDTLKRVVMYYLWGPRGEAWSGRKRISFLQIVREASADLKSKTEHSKQLLASLHLELVEATSLDNLIITDTYRGGLICMTVAEVV